MKYIKLFENYKNIESICWKYGIENYTITNNNMIDVNGNVCLHNINLVEIPLQFDKVYGYFTCHVNKLISLKGAPNYIEKFLVCNNNNLTSLEYCPKHILNLLNFRFNNIYLLDGIGKIEGNIFYDNNPISELIDLFDENVTTYIEYLEIYNFQKGKIIYKSRFKDALADVGINELPELKYYIYQ